MSEKRIRIRLAGLTVLLLTIFLVGVICRYSYDSYTRDLIHKEEQQLLTMARTIGKSLGSYLEKELDSIDLYFEAMESREPGMEEQSVGQVLSLLADRNPQLYEAVRCYAADGTLVYAQGSMQTKDLARLKQEKAYICGKHLSRNHWYQMNVARGFLYGGRHYRVIYALNLNEVYRQIVAPVRIGMGGYSIVKDEDLTIIMHHAADQIGIDALADRKMRYPQLDLSDLEEWIHLQETQKEGAAVIQSYKWDEQELTPEKRIIAYTTIHLLDETWIVNSTLPYEELDEPLQKMLLRLLLLGGLFLMILLILEFAMIRGVMREKNQKKEISYLKEINEGMVLLRRKEEEIQHYQRVQSIGEMSSHIAHEFNNYLTPIMVYGELLESDPEITSSQKEMVHEIVDVAEQAAGLSRRLLDFSRQDSSIVLEPIDLTREVKKACSVVRQLTPSRVKFSVQIPDHSWTVIGRKGMMEHILMNLCNNSFHAMEKNTDRECCLNVCLTEETEGDLVEQVCVRVSDTGCGISQDALSHIFEPFYTTKRSGKGTGLGLSVVQNVMKACNGTIRIESRLNEGTTFFLYFPVCREATQEDEASVQEEKRALRYGLKRHVRVLVIDDEPQVLKSLEAHLRKAEFSCAFYSHPAAALSRIQSDPEFCEILLTDYDMPSMNGLELAEIVRKLNPKIRIILTSGMDEAQFFWYLKNKIIDEFLPKQELVQKLIPVIVQNAPAS